MSENKTHHASDPEFDLIIIGGGFAGAAAAAALGRKHRRIAIVDINETFPPGFKAEKIDTPQIALLRKLDLLDELLPHTVQVRSMINMRRGHLVDRREVEDYGILYHDLVAALRAQIPDHVQRIVERVKDIELGREIQRVTLNNGQVVRARLVILATGLSETLRRSIGITHRMVQKSQCLAAGWTMAPPSTGFGFPALTVYGERSGDGVDYVTYFPIGENMRANFFMFTDPRNPVVKHLKSDPIKAASTLMPGHEKLMAGCTLTDGPHLHSVDLYICENVRRDGIVLIGDAFRTSCPAVGSGLTCALNDIERLASYISSWLTSPGMEKNKIENFYDDAIKQKTDTEAHAKALARRKAALDATFLTVARRNARFAARIIRDRFYNIASMHGMKHSTTHLSGD